MTTDATPLIFSIVIATYNAELFLLRCLRSVFEQTYEHVEIIVIDGGSNDNTVPILQANADKIRAWISEPDSGIYEAWNKALVRWRGDWILFLGADDPSGHDPPWPAGETVPITYHPVPDIT